MNKHLSGISHLKSSPTRDSLFAVVAAITLASSATISHAQTKSFQSNNIAAIDACLGTALSTTIDKDARTYIPYYRAIRRAETRNIVDCLRGQNFNDDSHYGSLEASVDELKKGIASLCSGSDVQLELRHLDGNQITEACK